MKKSMIILSMLCLAVLFSSTESLPASEKGSIKFGVLAPLTGTNAEYGKSFEVATQMAVDKLNADGGVNGYKIELAVKDSKGDQKESSDLCRQFVDDEDIIAIIGDFTSGACMANAPIVDEAGLVQLSPTASNPHYTSMSDYCFSIMGRQDREAPFYAKYIMKKYMGVKKVGVIYINSDWGKSCFDQFQKECEREGMEIASAVNYVQDEKDFASLITKLRASNPEAVCIMDQGVVPQIINQIRGVNWDVPISALGPGTSPQVLDLCGKNAEGLVLTSFFFFDPKKPELIAWKDEFVSKAGFEPTAYPGNAYDCVLMLAEAIKNIGDGKVTRQTIRDSLAKTEIVGISGPIHFDETGGVVRKYLIFQVEDGKYVLKKGYDYANE